MKKLLKTTKKLTVKTETVRNLTETQLGVVAGGILVTVPSVGGMGGDDRCRTTAN